MAGEDREFDENVEWLSIEEPQQTGTSPNRFVLPVIISGAILIGVLTLFVVAKQVLRMTQPSNVLVSTHGLNSSPVLWSESSRVFSEFDACRDLLADLTSTEENQRRAIIELLAAIELCTQENSTDCFSNLVDYERFVKRIDLTGRLLHFSEFEKRVLRSELKGKLEVKPFWSRLDVVDILTPDDDPDSRVVYAYGWHPDSEELTEVRFLIASDGDGWKVYDWVRCDLGLYESEEWSLYAAYANNPLIEGFHRWAELVGEADGFVVEGEFESAREQVRLAETQSVPPEFDDFRWVLTGYRWQILGDYQEAERCFKKVRHPQKTPGAYFGLMNCSQDSDTHQAIKYAELYEQTVGPTFELCNMKARMYETIHRNDLAIEEWKKSLRFQPNSEEALSRLLRSLPSDDKAALEPYLERLDNPLETIASMAPTIGWHDYEGVQYLGQVMKRREANAPATNFVLGLIEDLDAEYQSAADHYRLAFEAESDPSLIDKYADAYFESMCRIGEAVSAWQALPNPKSTFETLVYYHEMEESDLSTSEFREIAELYREKYPNDPLGFRQLADVATEEHRYEDAEQILRAGLEQAESSSDEQESGHTYQSLNYALVHVLYQLGRLEEAYNVPGDRKENFAQLCRIAIRKQKRDDLRTLLDWHRQSEPADPMLNYYAGELAFQEKRWDEAIRELKQGMNKSEEYASWMFKSRLEEAYVEADRWSEYYTFSKDQKDVFDSLARRFVSNESWGSLQRVIEEHQKRWRNDKQILKHQANAAWQRERYSDYIQFAESLLESNDEEVVPSYARSNYEDRLLSAMLRMKDYDRARVFSKTLETRNNNQSALAIVKAAEGNLDEAQRVALLAAAASESANRLYWNDDVGPIFLGPRFQQLHAEYPVELPYGIAPTWIVFHSDEPWKLTSEVIADALLELGEKGTADVRILSSIRKDVSAAYTVLLDGVSVWIATGTGTLKPGWRLEEETQPIATTAKNCQHWLAVGTAAWARPQRERVPEELRTFALQLAKDKPKAFTAKDQELWEVFRVYPANDECLSVWKANGHMESLTTEGVLWQGSNRQETLENDRQFRLALRNAVRKVQASPEERLEVLACLLPDIGVDTVRLAVTSVKRSYTDPVLVGSLIAPCDLVPELSKDLNIAVESSSIRAWRLNSDPAVFRPQ